jgi:hypothetical protein
LRELKLPSHATLVAYLALFVALGGTVYAASKIDGKTIRPKSIPGNRLKPNSVTGRQVKESSLNALNFASMDFGVGAACAGPAAPTDFCASTTLRLRHASRVLAIAYGGWNPVVAPQPNAQNQLFCEIRRDGSPSTFKTASPQYGETAFVNHSDTATSAFAISSLSKSKVSAGNHKIQLFCDSQTDRVERPTILALAISGG